MKRVILDTNFIVSCVKQKVDLFEELLGYKVLIPKQVIRELERIAKSKTKFQSPARVSLRMLEKNNFEKIDLGRGHVDNRIVDYSKTHPKTIVATLDKELQKKLASKKLIIRRKKNFEIIS